MDDDVLNTYRPRAEPPSDYSIEDHPNLFGGVVRELFEALRKEVLALDLVVREEFLKPYVAYKAETNFVDVVPQAKRLLLALNTSFVDITDPRSLCKGVTGLGHQGNGDAEVAFASLGELPYAWA